MKDIRNFNLKHHNTFGIDATCARFVDFSTVEQLQNEVLPSLSDKDNPLLILGGGSNLLLTSDYNGTVIHSSIKGIESHDDGEYVYLKVGSGEVWDDIVAFCVEQGWHGAENLSAIPGEVGASAVQNIGAYGVEVKDIIYTVEAVCIADGSIVEFSNSDCEYAYRQSKFKREWKNKYIITHVTYRLSKHFTPHIEYGNIRGMMQQQGIEVPTAQQLRSIITEIRNQKLPDPRSEGNAGSFFMNPVVPKSKYEELAKVYTDMPHYTINAEWEKIPAGWLIDQCGWKGKTMGRAGVHDQQALVLVNKGGATGREVLILCETIQKDVKHRFGITIEPEVNIL